jgi:hypothetical protein
MTTLSLRVFRKSNPPLLIKPQPYTENRDIIDTEPARGDVYKILLGSVSPYYDHLDGEIVELFPNPHEDSSKWDTSQYGHLSPGATGNPQIWEPLTTSPEPSIIPQKQYSAAEASLRGIQESQSGFIRHQKQVPTSGTRHSYHAPQQGRESSISPPPRFILPQSKRQSKEFSG